jgi:O-antigen ligase
VPLAVAGLAGGLLLLNVRSEAVPHEIRGRLVFPLIVGSLALVVAMIVYQTAAAPIVLPVLIVLVGAAIALFQWRRA